MFSTPPVLLTWNNSKILSFLESLSKDGMRSDGKTGQLSSATIQFYHRILKNIFNRAVEWRVIKENPVENIKKPFDYLFQQKQQEKA
ncbi:hypothetical protein COE25_12650 [Bacillus sp. AFS031507]|nr:hypothetical protein COE25_12650 [Bacillus sp. AFS031507]